MASEGDKVDVSSTNADTEVIYHSNKKLYSSLLCNVRQELSAISAGCLTCAEHSHEPSQGIAHDCNLPGLLEQTEKEDCMDTVLTPRPAEVSTASDDKLWRIAMPY